jgi:hypothetical protein
MPNPVPVTMSAMTPGTKLLSAAAASRLDLRLGSELAWAERLWAGRRSARAGVWPGPTDSLTDLDSGVPWPASATAPAQGLARPARAGRKDLTAPIAQNGLPSVQ